MELFSLPTISTHNYILFERNSSQYNQISFKNRPIYRMRFTLPLVLLLTLGLTEARKCTCNGGFSNTAAACRAISANVGLGCDFPACCVNPGDQETRFRNMCRQLGFSGSSCRECSAC
ncbi:hypothetical protein M011DRAFT_131336 [Sporormia fimetaria CBS 119925]|uniref:Uncharacterized protein n=1 Tax=Sporormia fimetaria CBS 119925 TaxID=1340428 RepID=A0A6A6V941_9PLEO|nr:hypothetical protein M011DRAFT_131336 [Sporormia fimetaria CBS 119925]